MKETKQEIEAPVNIAGGSLTDGPDQDGTSLDQFGPVIEKDQVGRM